MHRILVVEDNAINRELLCDWLEAHGYAVLSAEDVGGAQRLLRDKQSEAILLDVQLGSEDGYLDAPAARIFRHRCHRGDGPRNGHRATTVPCSPAAMVAYQNPSISKCSIENSTSGWQPCRNSAPLSDPLDFFRLIRSAVLLPSRSFLRAFPLQSSLLFIHNTGALHARRFRGGIPWNPPQLPKKLGLLVSASWDGPWE
jgi:hypothetical protein